jgi:hypothetical protein
MPGVSGLDSLAQNLPLARTFRTFSILFMSRGVSFMRNNSVCPGIAVCQCRCQVVGIRGRFLLWLRLVIFAGVTCK